jgi:hypothetical protein
VILPEIIGAVSEVTFFRVSTAPLEVVGAEGGLVSVGVQLLSFAVVLKQKQNICLHFQLIKVKVIKIPLLWGSGAQPLGVREKVKGGTKVFPNLTLLNLT